MKSLVLVYVTLAIALLAIAQGTAAAGDNTDIKKDDTSATNNDGDTIKLLSDIIKKGGKIVAGLLKSGSKNINMKEFTYVTAKWEDVKQSAMVGVMKDFGTSLAKMDTLGTMFDELSTKLAVVVNGLLA